MTDEQRFSEELRDLRWRGWRQEPPVLPPRIVPWWQRPRRAAAAAAVLILASIGFWQGAGILNAPVHSPYGAVALEGAPQASGGGLDGIRRLDPEEVLALQVGQRLSTPAGARLRLQVGEIGGVVLEEHSSLSIADATSVDGDYLLNLESGRMVATIFAAPRIFQVGTPAGIAVDLGCIYETEILADGSTQLTVMSGRVSFESHGREVVVPSGARVLADATHGPTAPVRTNASPEVQAAWRTLVHSSSTASSVATATKQLVAAAGVGDAVTLWYLLRDGDPDHRRPLATALHRLAPMPEGITLDSCVDGDVTALDAWRRQYSW